MATPTSPNGGSLKKTESYSASKSAMAAIFGPDHRYSKSNATESSTQENNTSGQEPPAGIKGKGTVEEPYDQGNAPDQVASSISNGSQAEPLSGVKGKGTVDEPYDQGNAGDASKTPSAVPTAPSSAGAAAVSSAGAGAVAVTAPPTSNGASTTATPTSQNTPAPPPAQQQQPEKQKEDERGRTLAPPSATDRNERSVSPGTLDDGSHETCSGEKGGSYTPSSGLGRLKDKFRSKN